MCHHGRGRSEPSGHDDMCGCSCNCPATTTFEEELQLLEGHKKYMQDHLVIIDKKIAALKSAKES
jgi:hypothetical protein